MNLVIVESPAKAKTIEKYLGKNFKVMASYGHVRDLPVKKLGVDIKNDYLPEYEIPFKAKKTISDIRRAEAQADELYLATDLDREGEAISWHILRALKIKEGDKKVKRITFSEITKQALERAVKNPRNINMNLVDAQQARRVLDRLVGYKLSPLLWRKVKSGLSAGRVQSVAVRLIVEREAEIKKFIPDEFWVVAVTLSKTDEMLIFKAYLIEQAGKPIKKLDIKNKKQAQDIKMALSDAKYLVDSVEKRQMLRKPSAPFTTSTLQMEASRKLGSSAKQTMSMAQRLYEAGHITYMRTDSTNISTEAITEIRATIKSEYGEKYLSESAQIYSSKGKRTQEAHEAIRPTNFVLGTVADDGRQQRLYELIWKRAIASQMREAKIEIIEAKILAMTMEKHKFLARGESIKFDGFIRAYTEGQDDEEEEQAKMPELKEGENLTYHNLETTQKFTEPPKRFTEAMLVKKLESLEIGRPSTYAPTISTIVDRGYVVIEERVFKPNEIAEIVTKLLVEHFAEVVDYQFTAKMEDNLDDIASGDKKWIPVIDEFYKPFAKNLAKKNIDLEKTDFIKPEKTNEKCPDCKKPLVIKIGKFGKFMACTGFPLCKFSKPVETKEDKKASVVNKDGDPESLKEAESEKCEKCDGKMALKEGRFGKFLACDNYPKCKNTKTVVINTEVVCPDCGDGELISRRTRRGKQFWGCSKYPGCKYASWVEPKK